MNRLDLSCTNRQREAILHTVGPAGVLAGPGSGKTFVTTHRIHRLITSEGVDPSHILVITFTKAAALEMQERFFRLMETERPPVHFGTFHAVFYHILKQSAQYRGHTIITEAEKRKLIRDILHMHKLFLYLQEEDIEEVLSAVSRAKSSLTELPVKIGKMGEEDFRFLRTEYQSYLEEFSKFDFDDLMAACLKLFREDAASLAGWQGQFRYILVDEFQDISPVQYEIVKLLAAPENNLFIVGDDDQSIYGFRGASPDSMQQFFQDFSQAKRILLDVNFRCHREIVEAAGIMIGENKNRLPKEIVANHENGEGFSLHREETEEALTKAVTAALKQEQMQGNLSACAMICRTNFACGLWAQTLRETGIPCVMREKPKDRFAHFVIQDIRAYLALAKGEYRRQYFLRIMNRPVRYIKRDSLPEERVEREKLLAYYQNTPAIQERVKRFYRDLEALSSKRLHLQIRYIRKAIGYETYLREKYGAQKAEEFIQIGEWFEDFSRQFMTLREMDDYISQYKETIQETTKADEEGVQLMTMHASKGLEFPTVFLPECNEGKVPMHKAKAEDEIEEERRMFYVAMTRAKEKLCLFYHNGKTGKDAPSRFLNPLLSHDSSSSTSSSNSAVSKNSSKASATASYSSSSSI
ncbi:MAG: ATP-dependent helicase [Lachnospiraceae bacterium]|nr:ATP-dependent helicase [Lachnospiraceae bacterium]